MKKLILILSLLFVAFNAQAQFKVYTVSELEQALDGTRTIKVPSYSNKDGIIAEALKGIDLDSLFDAIGNSLPPSGGGGVVNTIDVLDLPPLFTATESGITDITVTLTQSNATNNTVFGNITGGAFPPAFFNPALESTLFANEGTTTTVLHGNAAGNPTFGGVVTGDVTNGTLLEEDIAAQAITSNLIANGTIAMTDIAATTLISGTYSPTIANVNNVDASLATVFQYMRVGDVVTVSGMVTIDATSVSTVTIVTLTLPIASAMTAPEDCAGVMTCFNIMQVGAVTAESTTDVADLRYLTASTTDMSFTVHFTYRIK